MNWFLRPSVLLIVSVVLTAGAALLVFWPGRGENRALAAPLAEGDQEIVWLYSATSGGQWERFVAALDLALKELGNSQPELRLNKEKAFPVQTTAIPEVSVARTGTPQKLYFRWYKLTNELKARDWIHALLTRKPMPLAIIGGNSSDQAIGLAHDLEREVHESLRQAAPLLLLTTATADNEVEQSTQSLVPLTTIYPGRTFRFCFTNRQMAGAMVNFIWSRADLRPDSDPVYLSYWADDPYSTDLSERFVEALSLPGARAVAKDWARAAGFSISGGSPLDSSGVCSGQFSFPGIPWSDRIEYSVGTFDRPNRWEALVAGRLMEVKLTQNPAQKRPLLLISPAASQSAHRFLRGLNRASPTEAGRFVVATGDGIPFNAVYRDRNVSWPIQDLPFSLVFFCHRNPVDAAAGFAAETAGTENKASYPQTSGTEDILLNRDIVATVIQAALAGESFTDHAADFLERLRRAQWHDERVIISSEETGLPLFDHDGNRQSGTGEHIVYLRPAWAGAQIEPRATIEVWSCRTSQREGRPAYQRQALLNVGYDEPLEHANGD